MAESVSVTPTEVSELQEPRSLKYAKLGIRTSTDAANVYGALITDLLQGLVTPSVGNATCNAGAKLLKIVELQYKYGTAGKDGSPKVLQLATGEIH